MKTLNIYVGQDLSFEGLLHQLSLHSDAVKDFIMIAQHKGRSDVKRSSIELREVKKGPFRGMCTIAYVHTVGEEQLAGEAPFRYVKGAVVFSAHLLN